MFAERRFRDGGLGNALIRDGNGTRSFETLLRYRAAAMAEFWRALKTLKALQAEARTLLAAETGPALAAPPIEPHPTRPAARLPRPAARPAPAHRAQPDEPERAAERPPLAHRAQPDEPERAAQRRLAYVLPTPPASARAPARARRALATKRTRAWSVSAQSLGVVPAAGGRAASAFEPARQSQESLKSS